MKKWYQYEVTETVTSYVWIEADSVEEAEAKAYEADLEKNIDSIEREAILLEVDYKEH